MTERRRIVTDDEQDVHTGWRRVYSKYRRAGAASRVKKRTNRRERREGKAAVRAQAFEAARIFTYMLVIVCSALTVI